MVVHKVCGVRVPVKDDNILNGLQAAKSRKAAIVKYVFNLVHPEAECAIDAVAYFRSDSFNEFAVSRGGIRQAHSDTFSTRLAETKPAWVVIVA
jgi:hypothetical protein